VFRTQSAVFVFGAHQTFFVTLTTAGEIQPPGYLERLTADVVVDDAGHIGELELGLAEGLLDERVRDTNGLIRIPRLDFLP